MIRVARTKTVLATCGFTKGLTERFLPWPMLPPSRFGLLLRLKSKAEDVGIGGDEEAAS